MAAASSIDHSGATTADAPACRNAAAKPGIVAEHFVATADLARVEEHERRAGKRGALHGHRIERVAVDEEQTFEHALGRVRAVHREVQDVGGRIAGEAIDDLGRDRVDRHCCPPFDDFRGFFLRVDEASSRTRIDAGDDRDVGNVQRGGGGNGGRR